MTADTALERIAASLGEFIVQKTPVGFVAHEIRWSQKRRRSYRVKVAEAPDIEALAKAVLEKRGRR